jgi:hypothetical protein
MISNALKHDDTNDREVGKKFLEERGWSGITYGGYWDLDLEVTEFKRGCDVEMNHYNHFIQFKKEGMYRVPARKIRYWNSDGKYGDWKIDYIQFSDNKLEELLWYPYKLLEQFKDNQIVIEAIRKKGYNEKMSTFIFIPFEIGKNYVQRWKLEKNIWVRVV